MIPTGQQALYLLITNIICSHELWFNYILKHTFKKEQYLYSDFRNFIFYLSTIILSLIDGLMLSCVYYEIPGRLMDWSENYWGRGGFSQFVRGGPRFCQFIEGGCKIFHLFKGGGAWTFSTHSRGECKNVYHYRTFHSPAIIVGNSLILILWPDMPFLPLAPSVSCLPLIMYISHSHLFNFPPDKALMLQHSPGPPRFQPIRGVHFLWPTPVILTLRDFHTCQKRQLVRWKQCTAHVFINSLF